MFSSPARSASHAGSWYSGSGKQLAAQLADWLDEPDRLGHARAIISPHAGYSYCGDTAAFAFKQLVADNVDRVFILGPSHVASLSGCALTTCGVYQTPLGDINIDQNVNEELRTSRHFEDMERGDEETEHSIEMQLPFLHYVMQGKAFTLVPILVGSLSLAKQQLYGRLIAPYLANPRNFFIISSDFCHWGSRFHYSPRNASSNVPIYEQIKQLDREGMDAIETLDPARFNEYLKRTQNTICGRNPICVMLQAAETYRLANNHSHELRFLAYSQSNKARSSSDSSVSYAAGALFLHPNE